MGGIGWYVATLAPPAIGAVRGIDVVRGDENPVTRQLQVQFKCIRAMRHRFPALAAEFSRFQAWHTWMRYAAAEAHARSIAVYKKIAKVAE